MSRAVREALGHEIGNKTLEGYPGNRFHGGGEYVDVVERSRHRPREGALRGGLRQRPAALGHAGEPGGVLCAAAPRRSDSEPQPRSGRAPEPRRRRRICPGAGSTPITTASIGASGLLDYDEIEARAREVRPALLIAGGSAYPRAIDFERMARIAQAVDARLLVDMAHIAGLVAAGVLPLAGAPR